MFIKCHFCEGSTGTYKPMFFEKYNVIYICCRVCFAVYAFGNAFI